MCIGRDAPFVRSIRSHKIQTGTGQESTPFVRRIGPDKTPLASSTPGRSSRETGFSVNSAPRAEMLEVSDNQTFQARRRVSSGWSVIRPKAKEFAFLSAFCDISEVRLRSATHAEGNWNPLLTTTPKWEEFETVNRTYGESGGRR